MSQLPITPLSPEEQQGLMEQMYRLCGKQVQSYHKHHHMGSNSSVSMELAQELMESILYTTDLVGGVHAHKNTEDALILGQKILESKFRQAKSMLELVNGTAPQWQTECRWDALRYLRHYLDCYDLLHLAHKGPEDLFYPILISPPEGIRGIDSCLFYLNILWIENQIMAGFPDAVLNTFWDRLPAATLNQCEQLLLNGMGKTLLGKHPHTLVFEPEEYGCLTLSLLHATEETLACAADTLCQWLQLKDENACLYVKAILSQLRLRTGEQVLQCNLETIFL